MLGSGTREDDDMGSPRVVRVAEWDGWCGACAAERPLVLTGTGGRGLRGWLTRLGAEARVLVLTCRLCGVGAVVPPREDDTDVEVDERLPGAGGSGEVVGQFARR